MANKLTKNLLNRLTEINDPQDMHVFLKMVLTPKELEEIPKRIEIFDQLRKGTPQRKIAKELNVGIATVTRGSRELQKNKNWRNTEKSRQSLA
ncbi:transcriptional regulator [Candidatus Peregrinibacteria bacterium]|jgi:TrpR family transcriptional regulator, trp operon repressor|nr:transcriptional regulator [Candidatus Peregrinibacteria bacterium]MBT4055523.1 transcriptional regulator [Candidatus Peregrinibacteria bacterium]